MIYLYLFLLEFNNWISQKCCTFYCFVPLASRVSLWNSWYGFCIFPALLRFLMEVLHIPMSFPLHQISQAPGGASFEVSQWNLPFSFLCSFNKIILFNWDVSFVFVHGGILFFYLKTSLWVKDQKEKQKKNKSQSKLPLTLPTLQRYVILNFSSALSNNACFGWSIMCVRVRCPLW